MLLKKVSSYMIFLACLRKEEITLNLLLNL